MRVRGGLGGGNSYKIWNGDYSVLGTVHESRWEHKMTMKNTKGEEILFLDLDYSYIFQGKSLKIYSNENIVAEFVGKQDRVKKGWLRYNYYNTCSLRILDSDFDRKNLLGMFICCMVHALKRLEPGLDAGGHG